MGLWSGFARVHKKEMRSFHASEFSGGGFALERMQKE